MRCFLRRVGILTLALLPLAGCDRTPGSTSAERSVGSNAPLPAMPGPTVDLLFTYGSEKEDWIKAVTADFHRKQVKTASGKIIRVQAVAKGSGDCIDEILSGAARPHLTSPASAVFIQLGNAASRAKTGKDLIPSADNLLLSPAVIAMWQPMAEALGWPEKPVGWSDILALSADPQGWASRGYPQWGSFKLGHTHPQFSNSGLIAALAEVYAATGKRTGITAAEVSRPETAKFVADIEKSIVHYGSSTGFFGKKMFANGPQYLSAAVLYENMVIESRRSRPVPSFPIVAIYPKEGTFWSDHPAGIVDREWVTPEHRDAAKRYLSFLLAREQQERALQFGFRPGLAEIPLGAPIASEFGVNPKEPQTTLETPGAEITNAVLQVWQANKKRSQVTLVFDVSGSMSQNGRIDNARLGAQQLISMLADGDYYRLFPFNEKALPAAPAAPLAQVRQKAMRDASGLIASGGTALYDAVATAYKEQLAARDATRDRISAIIVLSDGSDTNSRTPLPQLLDQIRTDNELKTIRVFTIGYDSGEQKAVLQKISDATNGKYYDGKPENIREVFKDISTFF